MRGCYVNTRSGKTFWHKKDLFKWLGKEFKPMKPGERKALRLPNADILKNYPRDAKLKFTGNAYAKCDYINKRCKALDGKLLLHSQMKFTYKDDTGKTWNYTLQDLIYDESGAKPRLIIESATGKKLPTVKSMLSSSSSSSSSSAPAPRARKAAPKAAAKATTKAKASPKRAVAPKAPAKARVRNTAVKAPLKPVRPPLPPPATNPPRVKREHNEAIPSGSQPSRLKRPPSSSSPSRESVEHIYTNVVTPATERPLRDHEVYMVMGLAQQMQMDESMQQALQKAYATPPEKRNQLDDAAIAAFVNKINNERSQDVN